MASGVRTHYGPNRDTARYLRANRPVVQAMPLRDSTVTAAAGTPDTLRRGGPTLIYGPTGHTIMSDAGTAANLNFPGPHLWLSAGRHGSTGLQAIPSDGRLHYFTLFYFMIIFHYFPFHYFPFLSYFLAAINGQEVGRARPGRAGAAGAGAAGAGAAGTDAPLVGWHPCRARLWPGRTRPGRGRPGAALVGGRPGRARLWHRFKLVRFQ